jgi:hypothetical protein
MSKNVSRRAMLVPGSPVVTTAHLRPAQRGPSFTPWGLVIFTA